MRAPVLLVLAASSAAAQWPNVPPSSIPVGSEGQCLRMTTTGGVGVYSWDTCTGGSGAPAEATYLTQTCHAGLSAEQCLGALGTGLVINTTTTGVQGIYEGSYCGANTWASSTNASGALSCTQPAFTNISGTVAAAQLPNPGATTKGGIEAETCTGTDKVSAINTDGTVTCSTDQTSAGGGYATIREETSALTQRTQVSFVGGAITCADDGVTPETDCTVVASGTGDCGAGNFVRTLNNGAAPTCAADDDVPEVGDFGSLAGGTGITNSAGTLSTTSSEADFLASGALTCGASTQGKMQVHTTPLQYCDNTATPVLRYAAYGNATGQASDAVEVTCTGCVTDTELASSYSGVGACGANTWVSTLNDNAAPTCTQPAFSNLSGSATDAQVPNTITIDLASAATALAADPADCAANTFAQSIATSGALTCAGIATADLPTAHKTEQFTYVFFDPATDLPDTLDVTSVWANRSRAITLTEVWCEIDAGSATVTLNRDDGTPAAICSSLVCSTSGATCVPAAAEDNVAVGDEIDHVTVSVGAGLKRLTIAVKYTVD